MYDALYAESVRSDFAFYRSLARDADCVVDLGCGTGTFLIGLRDTGHQGRLVGIDPGRAMIARARARTDIEWRLGDAQALAAADAGDLIVMTGHAFQAVLDDENVADLLARVREALAAEGWFAFETRNPAVRGWEAWTPAYPRQGRTASGDPFVMTTHVEESFRDERLTFRHDFALENGTAIGVSRSTLRFMAPAILDRLLDRAGLTIEARYGDWDGSPFTERSSEIITIVARRP